jgi:hypothetical protein
MLFTQHPFTVNFFLQNFIFKIVCTNLLLLLLLLLHDKRHQLDSLFVINVFLGSKSCPTTMDISGLRVTTRKIQDFPSFHVSLPHESSSSARCATATDSVCNKLDVFRRQIITLRCDITLPYKYYSAS